MTKAKPKTKTKARPKPKAIKQHHPLEVVVSYPGAKHSWVITVPIDLWGLILGDDPVHSVRLEAENMVLDKLKINILTGQMTQLLADHAIFHGKK